MSNRKFLFKISFFCSVLFSPMVVAQQPEIFSDTTKNGVHEIYRFLEGRSAGVEVQNVSGTFGVAPYISIRGKSSLSDNYKPLWIIDGVVVENLVELTNSDLSSGDAITLISSALSGLNPDDIESLEVLKDGSATALYGTRALAGAIVITTKKGRPGRLQITYTGEYTSRLKPSYNDFNSMNSQQEISTYKELESKGWLTYSNLNRTANGGVYDKMYELINTYDPSTGNFLLENTQEAKNKYLQQAGMRNTDWFDKLFRDNLMSSHSLTFRSGNEKAAVYASLSALIDPGWYKQSNVNRYTANINASFNPLHNLSVNIQTNTAYRNQQAPDTTPYWFATNLSRTMDAATFYRKNQAPFNPVDELNNNYIDLNTLDAKIQAQINWKIITNLELNVLGAYQYAQAAQEHFSAGDFLFKTENHLNNTNLRASIAWKPVLSRNHSVHLLAGAEMNRLKRDKSVPVGQADDVYPVNSEPVKNTAGFAKVTYDYQGRYGLDGTVRYDDSNIKYKENGLQTFGISGNWHIHRENFFKNSDSFVSNLSVKTSYSHTNSNVNQGSRTGPEKQKEFSTGTEIGLFTNRININAEWYTRNNDNLITHRTIHEIGGISTRLENIANVKSQGFELSLFTKNIHTHTFSWNTNVIFAYNTDQVVKSHAKEEPYLLTENQIFVEGKPVQSLYSVPFIELNGEGIPVFLDENGEKTTDIYFSLPYTTIHTMQYEGRIRPLYFGSLDNHFRWKNWGLDVFFTGSFGNKVRLRPVTKAVYDDFQSLSGDLINRWMIPGDEKITNIPAILSKSQLNDNPDLEYGAAAYNYSSARIADGSFIQLKDIALSYRFPCKWFNSKIDNLSVELRGSHLLLFYFDKRIEGQDPSYVTSGGVSSPVPKQFTFTVRLEL